MGLRVLGFGGFGFRVLQYRVSGLRALGFNFCLIGCSRIFGVQGFKVSRFRMSKPVPAVHLDRDEVFNLFSKKVSQQKVRSK